MGNTMCCTERMDDVGVLRHEKPDDKSNNIMKNTKLNSDSKK